MPERPAHPYGLDPAEEPVVRAPQSPAPPATRREALGRETVQVQPGRHSAVGFRSGRSTGAEQTEAPAGHEDGEDGEVVLAHPATTPQPGSRRARRNAESARRSARQSTDTRPLRLPQIAAAALGVLAVLGGVVVAIDKIPGDAPQSSALVANTAMTELPTVSSDSTPLTEAPAAPTGQASQAGRRPKVKPVDVAKLVDKEKIAEAAAKAKKQKQKAAPEQSRPSAGGAAGEVKVGVFRGTSPAEVTAFGDWLGRRVDYAMDFSTRTTWEEIANPHYMLEAWKGSGYRMVYATAMLPTQDKSATMAAGARGEYDQYFTTLAQNLVAAGQGDAILRLGWEFNLSASRWHPDTKANFTGYWRHIVKAMRSVPGTENLQFDWNPNIGGEVYDSRKYYPGNDYVDYIGVDIYDISWAEGAYPFPAGCDEACKQQRREVAWDDKLNGTFGLNTWADFARSKGKPITLPEWGLWDRPDGHGGGDNPYYIQQMHKFIDDPNNNVAYQAYFEFDVGDNGNHALSTHTTAGQVFKDLIGK